MDVFALRDRLIREYEEYVRGFISIREPRTFAYVDDYFAAGRLWPEPLIQINPAFKRGPTIDDLVARLDSSRPFPNDYATLARYPLAVWAETAFGLQEDNRGRLERRSPRTLAAVSQDLNDATGVPVQRCAARVRDLLLTGCAVLDPETRFPLFAFRLHQDINRGDTVHASPEPVETRDLSAEARQFTAVDRTRRLVLEGWDRLGLEPRNQEGRYEVEAAGNGKASCRDSPFREPMENPLRENKKTLDRSRVLGCRRRDLNPHEC